MRILVVEDEPKAGDYLLRGLDEAGYVVDLACNGVDGLHMALEVRYDAIVLDVMMPQMNGWQVMQALRMRCDTPVLFLTARGELEDRLKGLELGADDYLVKPFSFAELLARIRVVLRRGGEATPPLLQVADLRLDPAARTVDRAGRRIDLSAKQYTLLAYLMRHAGQVVSRTMILEHVWDFEF